jgi:endonuclease/exonuclease/phosphatase family metal-dependent hydrolase
MSAAVAMLTLVGAIAVSGRAPARQATAASRPPAAPDGESVPNPADRLRPLRIVTFNMLHGGPWSEWTGDDQALERRLEMVAAELEALDPDIVALQEASVGWRRGDVAGRLAERLGLRHVHAPATDRVFTARLLGRLIVSVMGFREGPAILSRFPIVASEVIDLPRCRTWYDPRVLLSATLQTPQGALHVYSTHTSRDDCQLERIGEVVRARRNGLPSIVTGDLNTTDTMAAMGSLVRAGFVDAFRTANPDADGATVWQRIHWPTATASRRVDYVLLLPGVGVRGDVSTSRVVLRTPARLPDGTTLWPSDHYGVLVELSLAS